MTRRPEESTFSGRQSGHSAWTLGALALVPIGAPLVVSAVSGERIVFADMLVTALAIVFSVVGALIASRQPANAIGWILLGTSVATGLGSLSHVYVEYRVDHAAITSLTGAAAVYSNVSWVPFILVPPTFLLLLFPDGRLLSRRWRVVAWAAAAGITGTFAAEAMRPGPLADFPEITNPYGLSGWFVPTLEVVGGLTLMASLVGCASSLVVRYRRAAGQEREQVKWLALAGGVAAVVVPVASLGSGVWGPEVTNAASMIAVLGLPVAAGVAILRHRLYDIDLVINRTLVYGSLTAALLATYAGSVLLLRRVLPPVASDSDLAVAVSTLAVAALFRPVRRRIQAFVDRRFYRRRYDAARTLEAFGGRLREELDVSVLADDLGVVVSETMQPAHVSVWLRSAP